MYEGSTRTRTCVPVYTYVLYVLLLMRFSECCKLARSQVLGLSFL
jgi:hypothetical protein